MIQTMTRLAPTSSRPGLRRLLLVQRCEDTAVPMIRALEREGWVATWVERAADAVEHLTHFHVDMVVVGSRVLGADGAELCRELRRRSYDGGLVLVSPTPPEPAAGVDDHLCEPFGLGELQARVRTVQADRAGEPAPAAIPVAR